MTADGLGAQAEDVIFNAFTEDEYDYLASGYNPAITSDGESGIGDRRNTIRRDSELHLNVGMKAGELTLTAGLSREEGRTAGSITIIRWLARVLRLMVGMVRVVM